MRKAENVVQAAFASASPQVQRLKALFPGLLVTLTVALAATHVSNQYGGPVMLTALLLGMAFSFLGSEDRYAAGVSFSTGSLLKLGVALLGLRITFADISALGIAPVALVVSGLCITMGAGFLIARSLGLSNQFAVLTAGAVSICGASAAMAIAAALPRYPDLERDTVFTVIAVTALSTVAMIFYPLVVAGLALDDAAAGMFLGSTIHDVAQVVGAGYTVSDEAGDIATFTKLLRVALLVPLIVVISMLDGRQATPKRRYAVVVPSFLVVFVFLVVANSLGFVPDGPKEFLVEFSRTCLIVAIAGLGIKSSLKDLAAVGPAAAALIVSETLILASFAATAIVA